MYILAFAITLVSSLLITPIVKKFAIKIGAVDKPNQRKVHKNIMPRLGGLAIFLSFIIGVLITNPTDTYHLPIIIGSLIIIVTGFFDDILELSPKLKLLGQLLAAVIVVFGGLEVEFINNPFGDPIEFGILSKPVTIIWILAITNAINLIDGLDGLAAGVSSIALITISFMAILKGDIYAFTLGIILLGSTLGFLFYNFHPAKIFMGDTGALFLGYMIAILSLLGFKNITMVSFIIPIIILGVPISDTLFAIIRRLINKKPISAPDKSHLHHCLIKAGFTHRQTVLLIYAMASLFSIAAVILSLATLWGTILVLFVLFIAIELFVEKFGLINKKYKPILKFVKSLSNQK
jgi:UDP-GlcNAc:undecaprenyl-phosphate/decaprenyl-phosphate GlcNAc-1-phosphate transferase